MAFPHRPARIWHTKYLPRPEIASWHQNLARRPKGRTTADNYLRYLCRVTDALLPEGPVSLLHMNQGELEDAVTRCITHELDKGNLGSTVTGLKKALTSFLAFHLREVKRDNYIPGAESYPRAEDATIPEQPQLRLTLQACDARTAVCVCVVAEGGQRQEVLGMEHAENGLRLRDLGDLVIAADGAVNFSKVPCLVEVSKELSKNGKAYFFFLGPEACHAILVYLRLRIERGERLNPDSPLVRAEGGAPRFMFRTNIYGAIKRAMGRAGVEGYPHLWRSYYCNRTDLAQSKGLKEKWREFFMGHKGDIQTRYALRKKRLPADFLEAMRSAYAKALPYLESKTTAGEQDAAMTARRLLLQTCGVTDEELNALEEANLTDEEWAEKARSLFTQQVQAAPKAAPPAHMEVVQEVVQEVVPVSQVKEYLARGWRYKAPLTAAEVILEAGPGVAASVAA